MLRTQPVNFSKGVNKKMVYSGLQSAITAVGGFSIEQYSAPIRITAIENIGKYNVNDAVQLLLDPRLFNRKMQYDVNTQRFSVDSLHICAAEFIQNLTSSKQINSIGTLENIHREFTEYVNAFLKFEEGFSCIYVQEEEYCASESNHKLWSIEEFYQKITNQSSNLFGTFNDLYGGITVNGVNGILEYSRKLNLFGNRATRKDISDGFLEGDFIFVPYGLTMTISVGIDAQMLQLNELGKQHVLQLNEKTDYNNGVSSQETVTNMNRIVRVIKKPIFIQLIELPDLDAIYTVPVPVYPNTNTNTNQTGPTGTNNNYATGTITGKSNQEKEMEIMLKKVRKHVTSQTTQSIEIGSTGKLTKTPTGSISQKEKGPTGSISQKEKGPSGSISQKEKGPSGSISQKEKGPTGSISQKEKGPTGSISQKEKGPTGSISQKEKEKEPRFVPIPVQNIKLHKQGEIVNVTHDFLNFNSTGILNTGKNIQINKK